MSLSLITPPAERILTLAEAKQHLRVDLADEDALIQTYIDAVDAHLDGPAGVLGRALVTQTWDVTLPCFPAADDALRLPLPPLQSVVSIGYTDGAGAPQTLAAWQTYFRHDIGYLRPAFGAAWPATQAIENAVIIRITAGYGGAAAVPAPIRAAAMLLLGSAARTREGEIIGATVAANPAVERLLAPYRLAEFG